MRLHLASENETPISRAVDLVILPTTLVHIRELGDTIRDDDRREIESYGFSCNKGLWRSYKSGLMNQTAMIDGKVAAIWGVGGTYLGPKGAPWLLTSNEVRKISPLKFARIYQQAVREMLELFPYLVNYVLADYTEAVRLLDIVGFMLGEPEPLGKGGIYRKFEMRRGD